MIDVYLRARVAKWGNSLAIRLPSRVVQALGLKEGDHIEIHIAGKRHFRVSRDNSRQQAIDCVRKLSHPLPPGFKFNRESDNER